MHLNQILYTNRPKKDQSFGTENAFCFLFSCEREDGMGKNQSTRSLSIREGQREMGKEREQGKNV